ncbi:hypothetical protein ACH4E7_11960 [Kitasatospora sp. NPDC018058]|uniref:hypothetical protein n=1 Tax=Kitasatospora sp. NPDC018058 TaxID=3364025 RepID=UPI0037C0E12A
MGHPEGDDRRFTVADEPTTQYRSYAWEDGEGGRYVVLYPGIEEAGEERKARFRAMGAREAELLRAEEEAQAERGIGRPALRLVRDEDS